MLLALNQAVAQKENVQRAVRTSPLPSTRLSAVAHAVHRGICISSASISVLTTVSVVRWQVIDYRCKVHKTKNGGKAGGKAGGKVDGKADAKAIKVGFVACTNLGSNCWLEQRNSTCGCVGV